MDVSFLEEKSFFKVLGLSFSSKVDWGCYIICICLSCSMKFLSPEIGLYRCNSTIRLCMEYCCHVLSGLVLLTVSWNCYISYKNGQVGLLVLHIQTPLNPWIIVEMQLN